MPRTEAQIKAQQRNWARAQLKAARAQLRMAVKCLEGDTRLDIQDALAYLDRAHDRLWPKVDESDIPEKHRGYL